MIVICKECGEPFEAPSARIKYCSKVHYRPCPICGKPVEAKYLSDPPRKCEECRGSRKHDTVVSEITTTEKKNDAPRPAAKVGLFKIPTLEQLIQVKPEPKPKPEPEPSLIPQAKETVARPANLPEDARLYTRRSTCGFIHNHYYKIEVDRDPVYHNYWVTCLEDYTSGTAEEHLIILSSQISVDQAFQKI